MRIIFILIVAGYFQSSLGYIECGNSVDVPVTMEIQNLTSPRYPYNYPRPVSCSWKLTTIDPNHRLHFELISFHVSRSTFCSADYLKIKDGPSLISPTILNWCGMKSPGIHIRTTGSQSLVFFSSVDIGQLQATGFYMKFWAEEREQVIEKDVEYGQINFLLFGMFFTIIVLAVLFMTVIIIKSKAHIFRKTNKLRISSVSPE